VPTIPATDPVLGNDALIDDAETEPRTPRAAEIAKSSTWAVVWFTGLSGAGKSTMATMVCEEFGRRGYRTEFLDADAIRKSLSHELEFSRSDCEENIRRDRIRGGTFVAASSDCSCGGDYPLPVDARRTERSKRELL
jgi:Mrp family chromosome partitioning ATPase